MSLRHSPRLRPASLAEDLEADLQRQPDGLANRVLGVSARVAPLALETSKAGMFFRISDWDSEAHETHKDYDKLLHG